MALEIKTFVVSEVQPDGREIPIAVRLTFSAARSVARLDGGRRIRRFTATKNDDMTADEVEYLINERQTHHLGEKQNGDQGIAAHVRSTLRSQA